MITLSWLWSVGSPGILSFALDVLLSRLRFTGPRASNVATYRFVVAMRKISRTCGDAVFTDVPPTLPRIDVLLLRLWSPGCALVALSVRLFANVHPTLPRLDLLLLCLQSTCGGGLKCSPMCFRYCRVQICCCYMRSIFSGTCHGGLECSPGWGVQFSAYTFVFLLEIKLFVCLIKKYIRLVVRVPVRNQSGLLPYWTYSLRRSVNRTMFDGSSVLVWYMYVCFGLVHVRVMHVVQTSML